MKKYKVTALAFAIVALTVTGLAVAAEYGSQSDPLVTLSYINEVLKPEINGNISTAMAGKESEFLATANVRLSDLKKEIENELKNYDLSGNISDALLDDIAARAAGMSGTGGGASWEVVKIPSGKTMTCDVGVEALLRIGSATCVSSGSTGLVNLSDATVLGDGGALKQNNLYIVTIDSRGIKASGGDATVLVSGKYTIN